MRRRRASRSGPRPRCTKLKFVMQPSMTGPIVSTARCARLGRSCVYWLEHKPQIEPHEIVVPAVAAELDGAAPAELDDAEVAAGVADHSQAGGEDEDPFGGHIDGRAAGIERLQAVEEPEVG